MEALGLILAWGDTRRPLWFVRVEKKLDKISQADIGDVIALLPALLEYIVVAFLVVGTFILGQNFESSDFVYLYGAALLLAFFSPFIVKRMKLFSGGNAMATLGLIIAGIGVAIQVFQWL
ncbi:hypothetical protein A3724_09170 [Alcanivorax sp. HI0033]|nr:hypothetical protein A3714_10810 [Alcanivorax sp. HI0007]KZX70916.1 hypothetical protein A3713_14295 [Alcanivorax sp. HI0003]KZX78666.1 hypothetical protein A3717_10810 [Alcanivorax sp. HI0013]KZX79756.1 hypothetical protein A3716_06650 [Alcanivorax sp. HI0011]KZY05026.1 hypothetical protein A3724_09170 [Alcanivorax sp. HI0033]KZY23164.1 hypothetical protein A3725_05970 [Alcanivorax sp. HI0035]